MYGVGTVIHSHSFFHGLDDADVRPAKPRIHSCISLSLGPCQLGQTDSRTGKSESYADRRAEEVDEGEEKTRGYTLKVGQSDSLL